MVENRANNKWRNAVIKISEPQIIEEEKKEVIREPKILQDIP